MKDVLIKLTAYLQSHLNEIKERVLINHGPDQFDGHTTKEIGKSYSIDVLPLDKINSKNSFNQLIVGGSGLLSEF